MRATSGDPEATSLRLVGECSPYNIYFDRVQNGSIWHGSCGFTWIAMARTWFPPIAIVTDLTPSNVIYSAIKTAAKGRVDVVPDCYVQNSERYQLVDFSYPIHHSEVSIISTKRDNTPLGYIFKGIYDEMSYMLLLTSFILMTMLLWRFFALTAQKPVSFVSIVVHFFGNVWSQPFPKSITSRGSICTLTSLHLFGLWNFLIASMYGSILISMMTLSVQPHAIDTLDDLLAKADIKAYIVKKSYVEDAIDSFQVLKDMKRNNRIEFPVPEDFSESVILDNLRDGSHVLIDDPQNLFHFQSLLKNGSDYCRHSLETKYYFSKQTLFSFYSGWLYRKNLRESETINSNLMWLDALGLTNYVKIKKNEGIFSSNKMEEDCEPIDRENEITCRDFPHEVSAKHAPLSLKHFKQMFKYFGIGLTFAALVFLVELLSHSHFQFLFNRYD